ncbi:MAG: hypothetical protein LQ342_004510 [Letrouitia transgressa]|nr:MAG: hypothetical protein LQ342_004510 [Letrouitia transgressa]
MGSRQIYAHELPRYRDLLNGLALPIPEIERELLIITTSLQRIELELDRMVPMFDSLESDNTRFVASTGSLNGRTGSRDGRVGRLSESTNRGDGNVRPPE